jgi:hypothetical protein
VPTKVQMSTSDCDDEPQKSTMRHERNTRYVHAGFQSELRKLRVFCTMSAARPDMVPLPSARLVGDEDPVDFRMRKLESAGRGVGLDGDCDLDETVESLPLLGGEGEGSDLAGRAGATVAGESDGGLTLVVSRGGTGAGGARFRRFGLKI